MNQVPILPESVNWHSAIGQFLLNFGMLDYLVFVLLKSNLTPKEYEEIKEKPFQERLAVIAGHFRDNGFPAKVKVDLEKLLQRVEPVRKLRNHIAHGHLHLRPNAKTQQLQVTVFSAKDWDTALEPTAKHLEFSELASTLNTLNDVIEEFKLIAGFKDEPAIRVGRGGVGE